MRADQIIAYVAEACGTDPQAILSPIRAAHVVEARMIAGMMLNYKLSMQPEEIGFHLGNRDRTTVTHGLRKVSERMEADRTFRNFVNTLDQQIELRMRLAVLTPTEFRRLALLIMRDRRQAMGASTDEIMGMAALVTELFEVADGARELARIVTSSGDAQAAAAIAGSILEEMDALDGVGARGSQTTTQQQEGNDHEHAN